MRIQDFFTVLSGTKVEWIAAIVSLIGAIITAIITVVNNKKSSYVQVVVESRLQSVEERRQLLKDLIYYTEPQVIDKYIGLSDKEKQFLIKNCYISKQGFIIVW